MTIVEHKKAEGNLSVILTAITTICNTYCERTVNNDVVSSDNREQYLILPREIFCFLCKLRKVATLKRIGSTINRDYTTVIHNSDKMLTALTCNSEIQYIGYTKTNLFILDECRRKVDEILEYRKHKIGNSLIVHYDDNCNVHKVIKMLNGAFSNLQYTIE